MKVLIMSGISGSGKSSFAANMIKNHHDPIIVSADNYFTVNGEYRFDPKLLGMAHLTCMQEFIKHVSRPKCDEHEILVVDNTNTANEEIAPYYRVAEALYHDVSIVRILMDPFQAFKRNRHGVPLATVLQQHKRLMDSVIPYGWKIQHFDAWEGDA